MAEGIYGTRTSRFWDAKPAKMDALNLRYMFDSGNEFGIPDLAPSSFVPTELAAWHMPRERESAAAKGGALHFFLDDYRFESAFSSPERLLPRVLIVAAALTPDFSLWRDMPSAAQVWQVYRSRWCGAFWQSHGVEVIPTACWARSDTFGFCYAGLPTGGTVAVSALGLRADSEDRELFVTGLGELLDRVQPSRLLAYGKLRHVPDRFDLPEVIEFPTFWDKRRKLVDK